MVRNAGAPKMETTFYEDYSHDQRFRGNNVTTLKRSMTLDLNSNTGPAIKKMKHIPPPIVPILTSPDYNKLVVNTPELEKMIMAQSSLQTPTPSLIFPKTVTQEQEMFTRPFEDALNDLHHSDSSQGAIHHVELPRSSSSSSSSGATYMTLDAQYHSDPLANPFGLSPGENITVKEEPQTVPLGPTPPLSPIDMASQEQYKLDRKRERNRVAASKCRRRKLERIARLEDKVKLLKGENSELSGMLSKLKDEVASLKQQVLDHARSGCQIVLTPGHF